MATAQRTRKAREKRFVLLCDWRSYSRLLRVFADHPGHRLTYDRGTLEIMTLSLGHEGFACLLAQLIFVTVEEMGLPLKAGGSLTLRRRKKQKGLEPDKCYWIANEPLMRGKREFDPKKDPPPDLAIEVEISRSGVNRMEIYAALGVPEVWRFDGSAMTFYVLGAGGKYSSVVASPSFSCVKPDDLLPFLAMLDTHDFIAIVQSFRAWLRQQLPPTP